MEPAPQTIGKSNFFHTLAFRMGASFGTLILFFTSAFATTAYFTFNNYVTTSAKTQAEATSDTMAANYDDYFSSVISVSNFVASEVYNLIDPAASSASLSSDFDSIIAVKTDLSSVAFFSYSGDECLVNDSSFSFDGHNVSATDWFLNAVRNPTLNIFTPSENNSFKLSKVLPYAKGSSMGVLMVQVSSLASSVYKVDLGGGGHAVIYDKDYKLIYDSEDSLLAEEEVSVLKDTVIGYQVRDLGDHTYLISQYTISNTRWRLAIFQNFDAVGQTLSNFVITTVIIAVAFFFVSMVVLSFLSNSVTKPLKRLRNSMQVVEDKGYTSYEPVSVSGTLETRDLARNYNEMMLRIKSLTDDVIQEQNAQRLAELHALQNQINPHFLYNTLDSIVFLIDDGKKKEASEMVVALSRFFRISISKGRNIIPLEDEIEHVRNYLLIQKLRYKESFEYSFDVDPQLHDLRVIKLILQPLVENAIQHGLLNKEGVGRIAISGHMNGDILVLTVRDNGFGIMPDKIADIYSSFKDKNVYNGVGLKNVYQRLKVYFGEKADVKIDSVLDEGTTITLFIPVKERKINEE